MADLSKILPSQLMQGVLGKIYEVLTQGDDTVPPSPDSFFSWCTPGLPVTKEYFNFVSQGFRSVIKPQLNADGTSKEIPPDEQKRLRADNKHNTYLNAENFAQLVDFIPGLPEIEDGKYAKSKINTNQGSVSEAYKFALDYSQVADSEISDKNKETLERFKGLLTSVVKKEDLITGEITETTEASPLVKLYAEKMMAYSNACIEYNNYRISSNSGTSEEAIDYWVMNGKHLRNKVNFAMEDWINNGYKNKYEEIAAVTEQILCKNLSIMKAHYKDIFEKSLLTGVFSNQEFNITSLAPATFIEGGWSDFTFSSSEYNSNYDSETTSYGGEIRGGFSVFSSSAGISRNEESSDCEINASDFNLSFKMCQVSILRPWLKMPFLISKAWKLDPSNAEVQSKGEFLNNGENSPKGFLPCYPNSLIIIKDLKLVFNKYNVENTAKMSSSSYSGSAGWWPFVHASGGYTNNNISGTNSFKSDGQGIVVDGLQIIGFGCHVLPKSPDPLPTITNWI